MPLPINTAVAEVEEEECFSTVDAFFDLLRTSLVMSSPDEFPNVIIQEDEPDIEDYDKEWLKVAEDGKPLGWYSYYEGAWRRMDSAPDAIEFYYPEEPVPNDDFDEDGIGIGEWDGYVLLDGQDSRDDMGGKAILGVGTIDGVGDDPDTEYPLRDADNNPSGGGVAETTLVSEQIPSLGRPAVVLGHNNADGNDNVTTWENVLLGVAGSEGVYTLREATGSVSPDPVETLPPYRVMYIAKFIGYT